MSSIYGVHDDSNDSDTPYSELASTATATVTAAWYQAVEPARGPHRHVARYPTQGSGTDQADSYLAPWAAPLDSRPVSHKGQFWR